MRSRPTRALPYLLAFVLGLGTAGLAACGGKENPAMIPAANADELKNHLDDVLNAIDSEDCGEAQDALAQVRSDIESLPSGTSDRLLRRLTEATDKLDEQAADECQGTETETTATETTETETVETVTTTAPPPTTPTTTTPTTDTTATTPPTTPTTPPTDTTSTDQTGGLEVPER